MMRKMRVLALTGMVVWSMVWLALAYAQAPTLPETVRRLDRMDGEVGVLRQEIMTGAKDYERRLTMIEEQIKAVRDLQSQTNYLLTALVGAVTLGGGGTLARQLYTKNAAAAQKRDTKDAN